MNISAVKIETLLAEQGVTRTALAELCGISRQNISTIIRRGTCEPRTAGKLAAGLGVNVSDILDERNSDSLYEDQGRLQNHRSFHVLPSEGLQGRDYSLREVRHGLHGQCPRAAPAVGCGVRRQLSGKRETRDMVEDVLSPAGSY